MRSGESCIPSPGLASLSHQDHSSGTHPASCFDITRSKLPQVWKRRGGPICFRIAEGLRTSANGHNVEAGASTNICSQLWVVCRLTDTTLDGSQHKAAPILACTPSRQPFTSDAGLRYTINLQHHPTVTTPFLKHFLRTNITSTGPLETVPFLLFVLNSSAYEKGEQL